MVASTPQTNIKSQTLQAILVFNTTIFRPKYIHSTIMATNPAIAGTILRNFSIVFCTAVGGVFAVEGILKIATRKQMGIRGQLGAYNATVQPSQDRLYALPFPYHIISMCE